MYFKDRTDAGKRLSEIIRGNSTDLKGWTVVGLARGGVIIGAPIAKTLGLPLLSLSVGEFVSDGKGFMATSLGTSWALTAERKQGSKDSEPSVAQEQISEEEMVKQLKTRNDMYNGSRVVSYGKRVLLCDDGIVTGKTIFAAMGALSSNGVREIALAIPVIPPWLVAENPKLKVWAWRTSKAAHFTTGMYYFNFEDTPDGEVIAAINGCKN